MKPPTGDARAILERFKALESLGSDDKARLLGVIQARGARGDLPRVDVPPPSAGAPHPSWPARMWSAPLGKLAVALALTALPAFDFVITSSEVAIVAVATCYRIVTDCVVSCGCGSCKLHRLRR